MLSHGSRKIFLSENACCGRKLFCLALSWSPLLLLLFIVLNSVPAQAKTCTVITGYGPVYIGCSVKGSDVTFSQPVHGINGVIKGIQNPHNPGCYDLGENGITAVCTYRR